MRLQLIGAIALLCALLLPRGAAAQDEAPSRAGGRVDVYADGAIVVVAPAARASLLTPDGVRVDGGAMVYVITYK